MHSFDKNDANARLENTSTILPVAYGSIAFFLGEKADEYHTHKWTLYVRSPDSGVDLGAAISKVIFQLHPSFARPMRELTEPPFEVTERGWGEFEATIRIVWKEFADERVTVLTHGIKLYPSNIPTSTNPTAFMNTTVPVVSENYDEVVFTNPRGVFHRYLIEAQTPVGDGEGNDKVAPPYPPSNDPAVSEHFRTYGDDDDVRAMAEASHFLQGELRGVKDRLVRADAELEEIKAALLVVNHQIRGDAESGVGWQSGKSGGGAVGGGSKGGSKYKGKSKGGKSAAAQPTAKKAKMTQ